MNIYSIMNVIMKKNVLLLILIIVLSSCQKNEITIKLPILSAQIEQNVLAKTIMDDYNNILWSEGDQIIVFMKSSYGHKYQVLPAYVGKSYADFEEKVGDNGNISAGTEWLHNIAYYPYDSDIECLKSDDHYELSINLPYEQTYVSSSFGNKTMAMVAVSEDNNITFKNILGGIKLQLKGTQKVASIILEGKNYEKLSGSATVAAYTNEAKPAITMSSESYASVMLNCDTGVQLNESTATEFIIAIPPVVFSKGFTITVTTTDNQNCKIETDKINTVLRSSLLVMPEITIQSEKQESEFIDYIDEYGVNHGKGTAVGMAIWAPVNCGYKAATLESKGYPYGKLYQWGRKYGQGYSYDYDESIPDIQEGGAYIDDGNDISNENVFFPYYEILNCDWALGHSSKLWNNGSESAPIKTDYDPCPDGWRVPTYEEINELRQNYSSWITTETGMNGLWFSGSSSYTESVPQIFLLAAGQRSGSDGKPRCREPNDKGYDMHGEYWSSKADYNNSYGALCLSFYTTSTIIRYKAQMSYINRASGKSIRCVQE